MTQIAPALLPYLEQVLKQRGFYNPGALQLYKRNQVFGLIKQLDKPLEMHIRGFKDGTLEAEIEISREYFEHLGPNSCQPAQAEIETILEEARIAFTPAPPLDEGKRVVIPRKLTEWRKVLALTTLVLLAGLPLALAAAPLIMPKNGTSR
ncbi:MAG: hypothetical protein ACFFD8_08820 [Candidatus Thorarchaeota archaeon]